MLRRIARYSLFVIVPVAALSGYFAYYLRKPPPRLASVNEILAGTSEDVPLKIQLQNQHIKILKLRDSRSLTYHEYGSPHGYPIFYFHGGLETGNFLKLKNSLFVSSNVRLIGPNRPGTAYSDAHQEGNLITWVEDMKELVNALGLEKYSILASGPGAAFALATAKEQPDLVRRQALVAPLIPLDATHLHQLDRNMRMQLWLWNRIPLLGYFTLYRFRVLVEKEPESALLQLVAGMSSSDQKLAVSTLNKRFLYGDLGAAFARTHVGAARDLLLASRQWPFGFSDIPQSMAANTAIWMGEQDTTTLPIYAKVLHSALPGSALHVVPNKGHYLLLDDAVLATILQYLTQEATPSKAKEKEKGETLSK